MNPSPPTAEAVAIAPRPLRRYVLFGSVIFGTVSLISCVGVVWLLMTPIPIVVSRQTTYLTEPLDAEGFVDYLEAINRQGAGGVTPENNAIIPLIAAEGATAQPAEFYARLGIKPPAAIAPERFRGFSSAFKDADQADERPWSDDEFPDLATWFRENEETLTLIREASRRPRFYEPAVVDGPPRMIVLPHVRLHRDAANILKISAMQHLGAGRFGEAREDLLAIHRLARLSASGPTYMHHILGLASDSVAFRGETTFARIATESPQEVRLLLKELEATPSLPAVWQKVDRAERFECLEWVTRASRFGIKSMPGDYTDMVVSRAPSRMVDWNAALRRANQRYDQAVVALKEADWKKRTTILRDLTDQMTVPISPRGTFDISRGLSRQRLGELIGDAMAADHFVFLKYGDRDERNRMRREMTRVALALSLWHSEHGEYPAKLGDLVPELLGAVPYDGFAGSPLKYDRTVDGYRLLSPGPNERIDNGPDDYIVQVP